jgi:PAS domain S-box-containing protein
LTKRWLDPFLRGRRIWLSAITIFTFVLLGFVLYVGWLSYEATDNATVKEFNHRQLVVAKSTRAGLEYFFQVTAREMRELADADAVKNLDEDGTKALIEQKLAVLKVDGVVGISVEDTKKRVSVDDYSLELIDLKGDNAGKKGLALAVPIFREGEFAGVVSATIELDSIGEAFIAPIKVSGGGIPFLIDKNHEILWSPNASEIGQNIFEKSRGFTEFRQVVDKMGAGRTGTGEYSYYKFDDSLGKYDTETEDKLIAYAPVRSGGHILSIGISAPKADARDHVNAATRRQLVLLGSIIFIIFLGSSTAVAVTSRVSRVLEREVDYKTRELKESAESLTIISQLLGLSLEEIPLDELLTRALDLILSITWIAFQSRGSIFLVEDEPGVLVMKAQKGLSPKLHDKCARVPFGRCHCGEAALTQQLQFADSIDERHEIKYEGMDAHGHYSAPLLYSGETLGVLNIYLKVGHIRSKREDDFLNATTSTLAGIIKRKEFEQERERSEQHFRSLIDSSPDCVCDISLEGKVLSVNAAGSRLNGISDPKELIGQDCTMHITENAGAAREAVKLAAAGETVSVEYKSVDKGSREIWWDSKLTPVRDADGSIKSILRVARDITERKQSEEALTKQAEELARSNADLEQFAYVASHDLQEPLRMVSSYVQLLGRRYKGKLDEDADEFIEFAVDGAMRMKLLIDDLLAYSRLTHDEPRYQETDCSVIVDETVRYLKSTIDETGAEITRDQLPTVIADSSMLMHVFQNMISNAIKFHRDEPPKVHISAEKQGDYWTFSVQDNGIGIEPEFTNRIFKLFQRLHNKSDYPGTGMGLAICKKIIDRHGGRIWVDSKPGEGSVFSFTLPATRHG